MTTGQSVQSGKSCTARVSCGNQASNYLERQLNLWWISIRVIRICLLAQIRNGGLEVLTKPKWGHLGLMMKLKQATDSPD